MACFPLLFFSCGSGLSGVKQAEVGGMVVHTVHSFCYLQALWWNGHKNAFGKVLKQLMSCLRFGRLASDARRPAHSSLLMSMSRSIIPGKQYAEYIYKYVMLLLVLKSAQGKSRNSLQSNLSLRSTMFSFLTHHKTVLWEIWTPLVVLMIMFVRKNQRKFWKEPKWGPRCAIDLDLWKTWPLNFELWTLITGLVTVFSLCFLPGCSGTCLFLVRSCQLKLKAQTQSMTFCHDC